MMVDQLTQGSAVFLFLWLVLIAYLLPEGHTASPRWRRWVWIGLAGVVLLQVGAAGDRQMFADAHHSKAAPVPWLPETVSGAIGLTGLLLVVGLFFGSIVSLWCRTRAATGEDRVRLLWPLWGSLSVPAVLVFGWANHFLLGDHELPFLVALALLSVALPATIAISVLRHRLFDIELVLSRTVTYAVADDPGRRRVRQPADPRGPRVRQPVGGRIGRGRCRRRPGAADVRMAASAGRAPRLRLPVRPGGGTAAARRERGVLRPAARGRDDHHLGRRGAEGRRRLGGARRSASARGRPRAAGALGPPRVAGG